MEHGNAEVYGEELCEVCKVKVEDCKCGNITENPDMI